MKREFLKSLNLDDETIDKIMEKNGEDIEAEKGKVTALKSENETLKKDKKTLEDRIAELNEKSNSSDDWKQKFESLQNEIAKNKKEEKAKLEDQELTRAIEAVFGDAKFTSDYVRAGLISDMKSEIAKPENANVEYSQIYASLIKDKEGIFLNPNPPGDMSGIYGLDKDIDDDRIRGIMGLPIK